MGKRDEYVAGLKGAFVTLGTKMAFTALLAEAPWLNLPIIRTIAKFLIEKVLTLVTNQTEMGVFFLYIDTRVNAQASAFETAAYVNREVQKNGTDLQKQAAEEELFRRFVAFAKLTN